MKKSFGSIDVIAGLLMFCLFAVLMLFALLSGARTYKEIVFSIERGYKERTCIDYIVEKIRHYDGESMVYFVEFEGIYALALDEEIEGEIYTTLIYHHDGYIKELFSQKDSGLSPNDGFSIIEADSLIFEKEGDRLIYVECSVLERRQTAHVSLRAKMGGDGL